MICAYKAQKSGSFLQNVAAGPVVASIKGTTQKLGERYNGALVALYSKVNFQPLALTRSDQNGNYQFLGLNTDLKTFVAAFDPQQEYNAVISDNVVPK